MLLSLLSKRPWPPVLGIFAVVSVIWHSFETYSNQDHLIHGQHWSSALLQKLYLDLKKFMHLAPTEKFPYLPEHVTPTTIQYCLRQNDKFSSIIVTSVRKNKIGNGNGLLGTVWQLHLTYDTTNGQPAGPSTLVLKLMNHGFRSNLMGRIANVSANECFFYRDGLATDIPGFRTPVCYYTGWRPGYQHFCLLLEDLSHMKTGAILETEGISASNACLVLKQVARFHARFFNCVREKGPHWIGRPHDTQRYKYFPHYVQGNAEATLYRMKELEQINILPMGTLTEDVQQFVRNLASKYLKTAQFNVPVELGGQHHRTIILGDLRGGNIFLPSNDIEETDIEETDGTTNDGGSNPLQDFNTSGVTLYDFQLCREGCPAEDIDWFLGSVSNEVRQKHGKRIVRTYYEELIRNGVDPIQYPWHRLVYEIALYTSSQLWTIQLLDPRFLTIQEMEQSFLNRDNTNTIVDFEKITRSLRSKWSREFSMFQEFNSAKIAELAYACSPGCPSPEQYLPLLPSEWL